uniref:Uncharacterized protein n=1 Tax=Anopheles culicifacies TaxID=139723 RepID=A0A182M9J1_9DIPT
MTPDIRATDEMEVDVEMNNVATESTDVQSHEKREANDALWPEQQKEAEPNVDQDSTQMPNDGNTPSVMNHGLPQSVNVQKKPTILLSPSRRSARLSLDDSNKIGPKLAILSPRKVADNKLTVKCFNSPSKSIIKQELKEKGTPSKKTNISCENAMREALKLVGASKSHANEEEDLRFVANRSGLSSPKVARFSPLVVLEPITNLAKTLQDADDTQTKPVSHSIGLTMELDEKIADCSAQQAKISDKHHLPVVESSTNVVETVGDKTNECSGKLLQPLEQVPGEPSVLSMDQLSPVKNLEEEMEPLNKSLNRSIVSSPDLTGKEERNADLLNSTLNISPISEEKGVVARNVDPGELAGSADRRLSSRIGGRERDMSTLMSRRSKASPTPQTPSGSSSVFKARTQQQSSLPRSPRTNMIGLGGRGAQLINLIRNQQNDQSPKPNTPPQNASTPKAGLGSASANRLMMRKKAIVGNAASCVGDGSTSSEQLKQGDENCQEKSSQYLFFSKALPSPLASPASSILKRKHNQDESVDDIESPINKRKRVSFHDPPVSLTKEYIRQAEECRPVSVSRSLQLTNAITSSADRTKFMIRRKSKSDSISELQCFTITQAQTSKEEEPTSTSNRAIDEDMEEVELSSSPESLDEHECVMHNATDNMTTLQVTSDCMDIDKNEPTSMMQSENTPEEQQPHVTNTIEKPKDSPNKIAFASEEALIEHVLNRYTLDDIFERYMLVGKSLERVKSVRTLTKELSTKMTEDPKIRDVVLDELSERHSVEFLDHAIQENSNAKVCERLSAMTMIDHVFKQLHAGYNTHGAAEQASGATHNEKDDTIRVLENIFENLLSLPSTETEGQKLAELRDQLLRKELTRKSRLEIMSMLESYFKATNTQ